MLALWYSEGAKVFDSNNDPAFDDPFRKMLEMLRTLYKEELVPGDILTTANWGKEFLSGEHTYMVYHEYEGKNYNDPKISQIAGAVRNVLMPGKTRSTFAWTAVYQMAADALDEARVWNLMQFLGGKAKDGQYYVATRWAKEFGLSTPHKEVMESQEIRESFSKWKDLDVWSKQVEIATNRDVGKTMWFPEWDVYMMAEVQDYILDKKSIDELSDNLAKKAVELKNLYPA